MRLFHSMALILLIGLVGVGTGWANNISFGDAKKMANSYPPGGNPRLFSNWPAVDVRPFPGFDKVLYCENDWHVLAVAEFAYVYRSLDHSCDQNCIDTCYSCMNSATGGWFIPFATQKDASNWLKGIEAEFLLDEVTVKITRTSVKAYIDEGAFWDNGDGTIGGFGESFGIYLREVACAEKCSSGMV